MISSMTGFGTSTREADGRRVQVELRSVNHRYLKVGVKVPQVLAALEPDVEALVRGRVKRGAVTALVRFDEARTRARFRLDPEAVRGYLDSMEALEAELNAQVEPKGSRLALVMGLPGVVQDREEDAEPDKSLRELVLGAVEDAVLKLLQSRRGEGEHLGTQLAAQGRNVEGLLEAARARASVIPAAQRERLIQRVQRLMQDVDQEATLSDQDLLREICILSDKLDVTEELQRLEGHLQAFRSTLEASEEVGRKLDFLLQEFNREANTIGSKANDSDLAHTVVELKCEIERMREQVQNIE